MMASPDKYNIPVIASSSSSSSSYAYVNALIKRCAIAEKQVHDYEQMQRLLKTDTNNKNGTANSDDNSLINDVVALKMELAQYRAKDDWVTLQARSVCDMIDRLRVSFSNNQKEKCHRCRNNQNVAIRNFDQTLSEIEETMTTILLSGDDDAADRMNQMMASADLSSLCCDDSDAAVATNVEDDVSTEIIKNTAKQTTRAITTGASCHSDETDGFDEKLLPQQETDTTSTELTSADDAIPTTAVADDESHPRSGGVDNINPIRGLLIRSFSTSQVTPKLTDDNNAAATTARHNLEQRMNSRLFRALSTSRMIVDDDDGDDDDDANHPTIMPQSSTIDDDDDNAVSATGRDCRDQRQQRSFGDGRMTGLFRALSTPRMIVTNGDDDDDDDNKAVTRPRPPPRGGLNQGWMSLRGLTTTTANTTNGGGGGNRGDFARPDDDGGVATTVLRPGRLLKKALSFRRQPNGDDDAKNNRDDAENRMSIQASIIEDLESMVLFDDDR